MKRLPIFLIFTILLAFASGVFAQVTTRTPPPVIEEDTDVLTIESRLVIVPVSVTDGVGNPVKGLSKQNFTIKEEKKLQEISEVSAADKVPLEIALLIDVSSSTDSMFEFEKETAAKFLKDVMRPEDRATIFTIGTFPEMVQSRNVSMRSIETIKTIQPTKQSTAFYDTVSAAAVYLKENAPPRSRKVIIAISDGEDLNSIGIKIGFSQLYRQIGKEINTITTKDLQELMLKKRNEIKVREQSKTLNKIQDADAVFYSVNPAGSSLTFNKISKFGQSNMQRFADETGGTAFLPKFKPIGLKSNYENEANLKTNTETLETIFRQLAGELQSQYLIQYYSDGVFPEDTFVNVDVDVNPKLPQGVKVRAREGYFVKNQ